MSRSLARAVGGLSLLACVGAGFAMLREMVLASAFGAGGQVDAFLVAFAVPFLFSTSIISTLEAAFVPLYVSCKTDGGPARAMQFGNTTHFWLLAGGLVLTLAVSAAIPLTVPLQAPGFPAERVALARQLAWLMAPSILFTSLYAVGRSILNAEGRFLAPAVAPAVSSAVTILVMLYGWRAFGIRAAAIGYTAGTAAMWITVLLPILLARLPGSGFAVERTDPDVRRLFGAARPLLVGVLAMAAIPIVDRFMASRFPAGVISSLGYADRVVQIPITIVATAVTTATFPVMSRDAARRDLDGLRQTLASGLRLIAIVLAPAAVLAAILSRDLVTLLFERGQFTQDDVHTTAVAVSGLALGMVFMGTFQIVPRVFNALLLSPFVMLSGILNLGFKAAFNLLFVSLLGYAGFALATSAMYIGTGAIMLALLGRHLHGLNLKALLPSLVAIVLGAAVMAFTASAILTFLDGPLIRIVVVSGVTCAAYAATVWMTEPRLMRLAALEPVGADTRAVREAL